jgi:hypothetical protein
MKLLGAPPASYFDFSALSFQTPTNGSVEELAARRGAGVAAGGSAGFTARGGFWAAADSSDDSNNAASSIDIRPELHMSAADARSGPPSAPRRKALP